MQHYFLWPCTESLWRKKTWNCSKFVPKHVILKFNSFVNFFFFNDLRSTQNDSSLLRMVYYSPLLWGLDCSPLLWVPDCSSLLGVHDCSSLLGVLDCSPLGVLDCSFLGVLDCSPLEVLHCSSLSECLIVLLFCEYLTVLLLDYFILLLCLIVVLFWHAWLFFSFGSTWLFFSSGKLFLTTKLSYVIRFINIHPLHNSLYSYLANFGPTVASSKEELAVMALSGISPDCIPSESRHCAENIQMIQFDSTASKRNSRTDKSSSGQVLKNQHIWWHDTFSCQVIHCKIKMLKQCTQKSILLETMVTCFFEIIWCV